VHPEFLSVHDSNGSSLDFHAFRHTCGAWLALAGVHTKIIQSVMRHKDVKLTLDTYGHLFKSMEREALTKMEGLLHGADSLDSCPEMPVANHELKS
jgi:integrase